MARAGTVAVLLPGAFYFLREKQLPPVEAFRKHGVPIAIATDSNPGTSPITSLLLAMNMAATLFRLTVEEMHRRRDARGRARARHGSTTSARSKPASGATSRSGTSSGRPNWSIASASTRCIRASGEADDSAITLIPGRHDACRLARHCYAARPPRSIPACRAGDCRSARQSQRIVARGEPVYGINTGFGKLATVRIDDRGSRDAAAQHRALALRPASASRCPAPVDAADDGAEARQPRRRARRACAGRRVEHARSDAGARTHAGGPVRRGRSARPATSRRWRT